MPITAQPPDNGAALFVAPGNVNTLSKRESDQKAAGARSTSSRSQACHSFDDEQGLDCPAPSPFYIPCGFMLLAACSAFLLTGIHTSQIDSVICLFTQ